jgi:hypothetical protein
MRIFAILSGLALASAAALPATQADKPGHLTYGDLELDLKTSCLNFPQSSKLTNRFTKLQVNAGYTCELYG